MTKTPSSKRSNGTQAIDRALSVLSSFADQPEQGITDIATRTGLNPSTVHRIVRALVANRYLAQSPDDRYSFGPATLVIGQSARDALGFSTALPILEQLGGETGESINMGVLDGTDVVVVLRVESVQPLRFDQPVGTRISAHCSSMGKSLMAFSEFDLQQLKLTAVTSSTITKRKALEKELAAIRESGFSIDRQESIEGVSCVGAPVLDSDGLAIAAIAVQAPTVRMTPERQTHLGRRLMQAGAEICDAMQLSTQQLSTAAQVDDESILLASVEDLG